MPAHADVRVRGLLHALPAVRDVGPRVLVQVGSRDDRRYGRCRGLFPSGRAVDIRWRHYEAVAATACLLGRSSSSISRYGRYAGCTRKRAGLPLSCSNLRAST